MVSPFCCRACPSPLGDMPDLDLAYQIVQAHLFFLLLDRLLIFVTCVIPLMFSVANLPNSNTIIVR